MSGLQGKRWYFFIWDDYNIEHLEDHGVTHEEAEEVFFNAYIILRIKRSMGRNGTELMEELTPEEN